MVDCEGHLQIVAINRIYLEIIEEVVRNIYFVGRGKNCAVFPEKL